MENQLEYYVKEYERQNFLIQNELPASRFFHGLRMEMDQSMGQGQSEILRIHNGLSVAWADYRLSRQIETNHVNMQTPCNLSLQISGHFEFQISGAAKQNVAPGDIWFVHGPFEQASDIQFPDQKICGISIGLPQDFMEAWLGSSCCSASKGLEKLVSGSIGQSGSGMSGQAFPLLRGLQPSSECMRMARKLMSARRQTFADNLHFEALALDFLSRMLTLKDSTTIFSAERTCGIRAAVDEAVDILRWEWVDPPTISALSRRVGINECYLKKEFRRQTGMTIGAYIRQQRMAQAREMITTGKYSILSISLFVGYSNPSYFSAAFKKFYGHLPSYYLPKGGKIS